MLEVNEACQANRVGEDDEMPVARLVDYLDLHLPEHLLDILG